MIELSDSPSMLSLFTRAALKRGSKGKVSTPEQSVRLSGVSLDSGRIEAFHKLTQWQSTDVHPGLLHCMAFPLHLSLLLDDCFNDSVMGLVHIENRLKQYRPVNRLEKLMIECEFGATSSHDKGTAFDMLTRIYASGELVYDSTSRNLIRHRTERAKTPFNPIVPQSQLADWHFSNDLGRRYGKVSGDMNPIHLFPLSARLFGFPRHIAHGMFSKSRCLSHFQPNLPSTYELSVSFMKPVFLPQQVSLASVKGEGGNSFGMFSHTDRQNEPLCHLKGRFDY